MGEKRPISKDALFDIFKNQNEAALRSPTPSHLLNRSGNSAFRTPSLGTTPVNYNLSLHQRAEQLLFLNQLNFNSFKPNSPSTTGNSHEKMENQLKSPIRPLPVQGFSLELIKWHLKVVSINDIFVPEVSDRINLWVVLSGIIKGTRFSEGLVKSFEDGFPEDWRELLLAELEPSYQGEGIEMNFDSSVNSIGDGENQGEGIETNLHSNVNFIGDGENQGKGIETKLHSIVNSNGENQSEGIETNLHSSVNSIGDGENRGEGIETNFDSSVNSIGDGENQGEVIETNLHSLVNSIVDGEIKSFSGRRIRAPGNWWEINSEIKVKEEKIEPKKRKLSSIGKRTSSSSIEKHTPSSTQRNSSPNSGKRSRKRRTIQKDNTTENTKKPSHNDIANETNINETNTEETMVDIPRHEVYVLVEARR
ncbi:18552_t:CDS:2 [Funneliformis geosporum]|uniref:18552_t:CDS:1 n=1 Tax=Funneliformis geosporum TaxID=1117311 RepID=A0A9W4WUI9_9GLOM|nr:18552_t:CDS:2 [Funneliformis geosporum]